MTNNELKHFGILGMKWGVRRYRNEDGSLTDAGRKRYSSGKVTNGKIDEVSRNPNEFLLKTSSQYRRSQMSDDEIDTRIARLTKEKKLKDLEREIYGETDNGKKPNGFLLRTSGQYRRAQMTDEAIDAKIARLTKEKKLRDLERDTRNEQDKLAEEVGKKFALAITIGLGTILVKSLATKGDSAIKDKIQELGEKLTVTGEDGTESINEQAVKDLGLFRGLDGKLLDAFDVAFGYLKAKKK